MQHTRKQTHAYFVWVEARPTHRGKGRPAYYAAVQQAAQKVIATPITARDIEVEIAYSTRTGLATRLDADNVNKPTLDALKGVAYTDDSKSVQFDLRCSTSRRRQPWMDALNTWADSSPLRSFDCNEAPHVHVRRGRITCKFWLEPIELANNHGFSARELNQIRAIIEREVSKIQEAWNEHCG